MEYPRIVLRGNTRFNFLHIIITSKLLTRLINLFLVSEFEAFITLPITHNWCRSISNITITFLKWIKNLSRGGKITNLSCTHMGIIYLVSIEWLTRYIFNRKYLIHSTKSNTRKIYTKLTQNHVKAKFSNPWQGSHRHPCFLIRRDSQNYGRREARKKA